MQNLKNTEDGDGPEAPYGHMEISHDAP